VIGSNNVDILLNPNNDDNGPFYIIDNQNRQVRKYSTYKATSYTVFVATNNSYGGIGQISVSILYKSF
jgi:hypothetical protein